MTTWMKGNKTAIGFLRVSSSKQKDGTSHDTQETRIQEYCKSIGLELMEVVRLVESGKNSADRHEYNRAHESALQNGFRHFVFYAYDRETRNLTDNEINESLVKSGQIVLHYANDHKVVHRDSPSADFFMRDINAANNKHSSRQLSEKVRNAYRTKSENGWYFSPHLPLGYIHKHVIDERGNKMAGSSIVVPDTNLPNVRWVQREYELRAKGFSYREIRKQVIQEGLVPPTKIKSYHLSAVERRLKHKFYRGYFDFDGMEYRGKHELIIPEYILVAVDATHGKKSPFVKKKGIFGGGWLKCANPQCGCHIVYDPKIKRIKSTGEEKVYHYYHCSNGRGVHANFRGLQVEEAKLWSQMENILDSISITEDFAKAIADALNHNKERTLNKARQEIAAYEEAIARLNDEEDSLYRDYRNSILSQDQFERLRLKIREERAGFTTLMKQQSLAITDAGLETAKSILELATYAKSQWVSQNAQERRIFLDKILSNQVLDGPTVRYSLQKPFLKLVELKQGCPS